MLGLLVRRPRFRRLFLAHAASRAGDAFNTVALVVLVFRLTGSGKGVATTVAFEVTPVLLVGPVAGAIVDRVPRRRVMVAADLVRAVLVAALVVFHGSVALAFAVAFGVSAATQLFNPAVSSLVPDLVAEDEIVTANSALWTAAVLAQIVLAPAAGILIATAGVAPAFAVNSISFTLSALVLRGLGGDGPSVGGDWRSLSGGFQAVRRHPLLRRLAVVQGLAALSAGATSGLLVVLAADWLHVGPSGFGILLAAIGVGAAAGPLLLRSRIRPGIRRWLFGPFLLRGAVDLILAGVPNAAVAAVALGFYGVGTSTGMVAYQSTLQTEVSSDVRGRVFVFFDVVWNVARLLSLGFGGAIADAIGIRVVYAIGGVLLIAAAGLGSLGRASAVK